MHTHTARRAGAAQPDGGGAEDADADGEQQRAPRGSASDDAEAVKAYFAVRAGAPVQLELEQVPEIAKSRSMEPERTFGLECDWWIEPERMFELPLSVLESGTDGAQGGFKSK